MTKLILISLILIPVTLNSQQVINNTNNSIEEYIYTISKELNLDKHVKITFNNTETNTAMYVLSDERNANYEVYLKNTNDRLFYAELICVCLLRIKELDEDKGYVNWKDILYKSSKLAFKYQHLITMYE